MCVGVPVPVPENAIGSRTAGRLRVGLDAGRL